MILISSGFCLLFWPCFPKDFDTQVFLNKVISFGKLFVPYVMSQNSIDWTEQMSIWKPS